MRDEETASIVTTELRVRIPPGAVEAGETYAIEVAAIRNGDIDLATAPYRRGFPGARAERATAALHTIP